MPGPSTEGLYQDEDFREGLARLGEREYTFDAWHFHHQNPAFRDLAAAVPGTTIILDHFGTPLGSGSYAGKREEIFAVWREDISAIAECANVIAKLGGLAMPVNGFGWDTRAQPAGSDELLAAQQDYYLHAIDAFGPERCMLESNFPVDKLSLSYHVLWNGLKKIVKTFSEDEKDAMFHRTAARVYRL